MILFVSVLFCFFSYCFVPHPFLHSFPTRRSSDLFIPKLRLILILNSFLGSSDSLVFSELFHSLAPRPLAAKEWNNSLKTDRKRFSRNAETDLVCRLLLEKKKNHNANHRTLVYFPQLLLAILELG